MRALRAAPIVASLLILAMIASLILVSPTPAHAAAFTVISTADEPDASPGDGLCAAAPSGACTLRAALIEANTLPGADTVMLPAGHYQVSSSRGSVIHESTGDFDITSVIRIIGVGAATTIVDGQSRDRVFRITSEAVVEMSGLTITGGLKYRSDYFEQASGGGVFNAGTLKLMDTAIEGNTSAEYDWGTRGSSNYGGGITNTGVLTLERVALTGNKATGKTSFGGALWNSGVASLTNVTVGGNSVSTFQEMGGGGGLANSGSVMLRNVTFYDNSSRKVSDTYRVGGQNIHGVWMNDNMVVRTVNTILLGADGGNCNSLARIHSEGNNIENGDTCALNGPHDLSNVNPQLASLANNGGPTQTNALLPGSLAIDRGRDASCPPTDQRGAPRPRDGNGDGNVSCDIGAFEHQPTASWIVCTPRPPVQVVVTRAGPNTLSATITATGSAGDAPNRLRALQFGRVTNATIDAGWRVGLGANQTVTFPDGPAQTTFVVHRGPNSDAMTVELAVIDDCGPWKTFVGDGRRP